MHTNPHSKKDNLKHLSTDIRHSSSSSEGSPTLIPPSSNDNVKKPHFFHKLRTISSNGEWIIPEKRYFHEDMNSIFSEDPNKFLGDFHTDFYKVSRKFVRSLMRPAVELYYTRMEPSNKIKGQIAIVHGFGEHSGRYLTVKFIYFLKNKRF